MKPRLARRLAPCLLLGSWMWAWSAGALALDPALDVDQYAHTAWRIREGFGRGVIHSFAQTPDGYLWFGTEFGLARFDGVRLAPWQPPDGQALPGIMVGNLLAARDGRLWIATYGGLASLRDGKMTNYPHFSGWTIYGLQEDREGTLWITGRSTSAQAEICAIQADRAQCGADGRLGDWLGALYRDSAGRLWVTSRQGVWRWLPGPPEFFAMEGVLDSTQSMSEDDEGALLVATRHGLMRIKDGKISPFPIVVGLREPRSVRLLRDRDGGLWAGTEVGISHLHRGRVDVFTPSNGLTSEYIGKIFEDREGSIWVATRDGLDRFRELAVPTLTMNQGLSDNSAVAVLAARDGSLWISTSTGLDRWRNGEFTHYRGRALENPATTPAANPGNAHEVLVRGLQSRISTLFEDHRGRLWVGSPEHVGYLENDQWTPADDVPSGYIDGITEDSAGNIWFAHRAQGLLRLAPDGRLSRFDWNALGGDSARRMAVDRRGGIWLGFLRGGVAHVVDGRVDVKFTEADGLGKGRVSSLRMEPDGTVWVGSAGGLSRIRSGRIATLNRDSGLPCDETDWIIEDATGASWIYTACGIVRVERKELVNWLDDAERGELARTIRLTSYGETDGVRSAISISSFDPHVARAPDGKLWFATLGGVGVIDPQHLARNPLPPPVHIEAMFANRAFHDLSRPSAPLQLPPLIRDLQINYTGLSLVAPEKMQFRYRLVGRDRDWQEVGTRRQAFYSDLAPGDYRFQVIASNNDGVWNEQGASVAFAIAPIFYQTRWFMALCAAGVLLALWILYKMRVRQIESRVQLRLDERVEERERIARELHDTFLQSVQGLILKFHAAMTRMPQDVPSRQMMEEALERADEVVTEGRNRVFGLRDTSEPPDLAQSFAEAAREFSHLAHAEFRVTVQGTPRKLHPLVREEVFRIGAEALVNAFRHAHARRIDIEIEYARKELCLRITDDGRGFDVNVLDAEPRKGHFGLTGLRERAHRIRSHVQLSSRVGSGSAVELRVPGAIAYAAPRHRVFR